MQTTQRLSLITLGVSDIARSKAFYEALGWQAHPQSQGEEIVFFQMNGFVLGLYPLPALAADQKRPLSEIGSGAITLAQNFATEDEVLAFHAKALAAGASSIKAPEKVFWGGFSGYFADPDGHPWEVAMNPFWPLNEDGSLTLPTVEDA